MTTIECKEVCMSFGDQIVLDHISMRFENGHIYGITGRNGSGKTVLLKLICGLMTPTSGMILMNGKPVGASGTMHAETVSYTHLRAHETLMKGVGRGWM